MDELIHHCLRELAFDGDLGCDIGRLKDFIQEFYSQDVVSSPQKVDDAFSAFVWSVIVQQPGVRVGTIPPGAATEVYIAPQASAQKKAKAKGEEVADRPAPTTTLNIVSDAAVRPMEELRTEYGDRLRVAVDPNTILAAITGSHIRHSKLTPMVYSALQLITRGRHNGISVVELGKKSGYDQKTCFYLVKQLVSLEIVVKRRKPGVGINFCIHKYFFDRSPVWKQVLEEEAEAEAQTRAQVEKDDDEEDENQLPSTGIVRFDPMDEHHLSSLPLLQARIVKLLKAAPSNIFVSQNLLIHLGFSHPTKTHRRFFHSRLGELIEQGVIERVQVPHSNKQRYPDKKVACIRLITQNMDNTMDVMPSTNVNEDEDAEDDNGLKANITIHKQIIDMVHDSGMTGITLNEISHALCDMDKRIVELLLTRLEKEQPPAHLSDLGIAQLPENHGRERRYRYHTIPSFLAIAAKEDYAYDHYSDVDLSKAGDFLAVDPSLFYDSPDVLLTRVDTWRRDGEGDKSTTSKAKKRVYKNPILPDGHVKKGRPRKEWAQNTVGAGLTSAKPKAKPGKKRKLDEGGPDPNPGPSTQPNGGQPVGGDVAEHPSKRQRSAPTVQQLNPQSEEHPVNTVLEIPESTPVRKRGRPPKPKPDIDASKPQIVKRRGRPPKKKLPTVEELAPRAARVNEPDPIDITVVEPTVDPSSGQNRKQLSMQMPNDVQGASMPGRDEADSSTLENGDSLIVPMDLDLPRSMPGRDEADSSTLENGDSLIVPMDLDLPSQAQPASLTSSECVDELYLIHRSNAINPASDGSPLGDEVVSPQIVQADMSTMVTEVEHQLVPIFQPNQDQLMQAALSHTDPIPIDPALLNGSSMIPPNSLEVPSMEGSSLTTNPDNERSHQNSLEPAKRDKPDTPTLSVEPPFKRAKTGSLNESGQPSRAKANMAGARREKEVLKLISDAGGIVNLSSKDFFDSHAALLAAMTEAGEPVSTRVGSRLDKRTLDTTVKGLEARKLVRFLTTSITTTTGNTRPVKIAHFPDVSQEDLNTYLITVSRNMQVFVPTTMKTIDEPISYGGKSIRDLRSGNGAIVLTKHKATIDQKPVQLLSCDDETVHSALLTEKTTLAQLYGFIVGKAQRASRLHLLTLELFENASPSSWVVSREQRIVHMLYYYNDLPISTYCALVPCLNHHEDLLTFMKTDEGQQTPVRNLPTELYAALQISRSRSKSRFLSLMEILMSLGIVTPLLPSTSETADIRCPRSGEHPDTFEVAPSRNWIPTSAPVYWQFNRSAPQCLWALSESTPPLWKYVPVSTVQEAAVFWNELESVCFDKDKWQNVVCLQPDVNVPLETARCLRRPYSWNTSYNLSWWQMEYLKQCIDATTGDTPLQDEACGEEHLKYISWVTSAPLHAIRQFFQRASHRREKENAKAQRKVKVLINKRRKEAEAKAQLARKAAQSKLQREQGWMTLVAHVHPQELDGSAAIRVGRLRERYLQSSGNDHKKWEAKISQAIQESTLALKKVTIPAKPPVRPFLAPSAPPPLVPNAPEMKIEDLIAQQGPPVAQQRAKTPKKRKNDNKETTPKSQYKEPARRYRFQWNRHYDELARDASAVIKARCRNGLRLEWGALDQIFPAIPRNSVRQRIAHLKEQPGMVSYFKRLEDRWYDLWVEYRGTSMLPDEDIGSATNFDIAAHIRFLRSHVDKNAIRVGLVETAESRIAILPAAVDRINEYFDIIEKPILSPSFDFIWSGSADEGRGSQFTHQAFINDVVEMPPAHTYSSERVHVADSVLKMILGTPSDNYDAEVGAQLLKVGGQSSVKEVTKNLLDRGVLSKTLRDPNKSKPGRTLKISDSNQNAIGGSIPVDTFLDATALEESFTQQTDEWRQWPLLASDGDTAALLELVSENRVDFRIDTSSIQDVRRGLDWNSKKADDHDIETDIHVRCSDPAPMRHRSSSPEWTVEPLPITVTVTRAEAETAMHGKTASGDTASCRKLTEGLVDCQACLDDEASTLLSLLEPEQADIAQHVLAAVRDASYAGVTKDRLVTDSLACNKDSFFALVDRMANSSPPLVFWTGYTSTVLVSATYLKEWAVEIPGDKIKKLLPRRWLDITGRTMKDIWEAALRAVIGVIVLRPGVTQAEIRWRLRSVYDRQEVNDVLEHLLEEGYTTRLAGVESTAVCPGPPDDREEKEVFWFLGARHWYEV